MISASRLSVFDVVAHPNFLETLSIQERKAEEIPLLYQQLSWALVDIVSTSLFKPGINRTEAKCKWISEALSKNNKYVAW
jgi:hypothetical protein